MNKLYLALSVVLLTVVAPGCGAAPDEQSLSEPTAQVAQLLSDQQFDPEESQQTSERTIPADPATQNCARTTWPCVPDYYTCNIECCGGRRGVARRTCGNCLSAGNTFCGSGNVRKLWWTP